MVVETKQQTSHLWWFDSHNTPTKRSPWLQSTLSELEDKTKAMLKVINEDADSFAKRAEMYYKKRPELISMVEDFYRAHRSLAEKYDQAKFDSGNRFPSPFGSPWTKYQPAKLSSLMDQTYDSYSDTCGPEESTESDIEDPENEDVIQGDKKSRAFGVVEKNLMKDIYEDMLEPESDVEDPDHPEEEPRVDEETCKEEALNGSDSREVINEEVAKLREEIERLKEENKMQKEQLIQKDEEKREVIRQLSLAIEVLKEENVELRKCMPKEAPKKNKDQSFEFGNLKKAFLGELSNGILKPKPTVVAL